MEYRIRLKEVFSSGCDAGEITYISYFTTEAQTKHEAYMKALDYCISNSHGCTEWEVDDLEFISTYGFPTDETPRE